jgi:hypothetical protein
MALPEGITQADLDRAAKLKAGVEKLEAELKELTDRIKDAFPAEKKTYIFEGVSVGIGLADRLDAKEFEATYDPKEFPELFKLTPDPRAIREQLGKATAAPFFKTGKTLTLKQVENSSAL